MNKMEFTLRLACFSLSFFNSSSSLTRCLRHSAMYSFRTSSNSARFWSWRFYSIVPTTVSHISFVIVMQSIRNYLEDIGTLGLVVFIVGGPVGVQLTELTTWSIYLGGCSFVLIFFFVFLFCLFHWQGGWRRSTTVVQQWTIHPSTGWQLATGFFFPTKIHTISNF